MTARWQAEVVGDPSVLWSVLILSRPSSPGLAPASSAGSSPGAHSFWILSVLRMQPAGLSCVDNVVKECEEEASIPADLARTARSVGVVSYAGV